MKNSMKILGVFLLAMVAFTFCKKEEEESEITPEITNVVAENHDGGTQISLSGTISVDFDAKSQIFAHQQMYQHALLPFELYNVIQSRMPLQQRHTFFSTHQLLAH